MNQHPPADVSIDERLIRALLRQSPELSGLPLSHAGHGWDNEIWRLGDDLAVRLPRRAAAEPLLRNEVRWLPSVAARLPLPVPTPVFTGRPADGYPYAWAVTRWLPGMPATRWPPTRRDSYAEQFAAVLHALHAPAPPDAPVNVVRGVPIAERASTVRAAIRTAGAPLEGLRAVLDDAVAAPAYDDVPRWLHGDPHPYNTLVDDTGLAALIDFGDITAGDPASDLGVAWLHFTGAGRTLFFERYGAPSALRRRSRGWAACFVAAMTALDPDHPLRACGEHGVRELLA